MREFLERLLGEQLETDKDLKLLLAEQCPRIRGVVDTIAEAPFPMFMVIGPDRRLVYNEAYIPILGARHPSALGKPFFEVWPEVVEEVTPVIDEAFAGHSTLFQDMRVMLSRPTPQTGLVHLLLQPGSRRRRQCRCGSLPVYRNDRNRDGQASSGFSDRSRSRISKQ